MLIGDGGDLDRFSQVAFVVENEREVVALRLAETGAPRTAIQRAASSERVFGLISSTTRLAKIVEFAIDSIDVSIRVELV
ncbi:hypothetical protein Rleg5DRAFT_7148 [Rhizobium leguminosarum bv. viciae WSM1455]|nr:hypothetical protein Rleg5DRAFT_7148 [Rhizobium leguminosarum bv. viciae WSM1455]